MNELELLCHYEAKDDMADQGYNEMDLVFTWKSTKQQKQPNLCAHRNS